MKLYKVIEAIECKLNEATEDGELTLESMNSLNEMYGAFEEIVINIASYIKNCEAESEAIKTAVASMVKRANSLSHKAERLTQYLQLHLENSGITEIKSSPYFKIKLKKCPPSVDVLNEDEIPKEYWTEKITSSLDKVAIKQDIGAGFTIPGVQLINKIKLEIK